MAAAAPHHQRRRRRADRRRGPHRVRGAAPFARRARTAGSGIACASGTSRQAAAAEQAAIALIDDGVRAPRWAEYLGAVSPAECYVNPDEWGDQDEVICVFSYAGEEPHALVSVIDYNASGMIRDGWVSSQVDKLLDHCRRASAKSGARPDEGFRQIASAQARKMLQAAFAAAHAAEDPPSERGLRRQARLHPRPHPRPAARRRPHRAAQAGLAGRAAGAARRGVPRLRRGGGAVSTGRRRARCIGDLIAHRLRLRPGQRAAAADVARQGAELHARLAAAQGAAHGCRPERDAARRWGVDSLVGTGTRAVGDGRQADARHSIRLYGDVLEDLP